MPARPSAHLPYLTLMVGRPHCADIGRCVGTSHHDPERAIAACQRWQALWAHLCPQIIFYFDFIVMDTRTYQRVWRWEQV